MSSSVFKEVERVLKKDLVQSFKKSPDDITAIVKNIFQSFISNETDFTKKTLAAKDSLGKQFTPIYNSLLLITSAFYSDRTTSDGVEGKLQELELDPKFVDIYVASYSKFIDYMESPESLSNNFATAQNKLLDFRWEMRETIFDTEFDIPKSNLVVGEFIYLDNFTGMVKRFRCLVPTEMTEQIARETDLALLACKNLKDTFN